MSTALEPFTPTFDHALIESTRERLAKTDFPRPKRLRIGSRCSAALLSGVGALLVRGLRLATRSKPTLAL